MVGLQNLLAVAGAVSLALSAAFLVLALHTFLREDIPGVLADLSGRRRAAALADQAARGRGAPAGKRPHRAVARVPGALPVPREGLPATPSAQDGRDPSVTFRVTRRIVHLPSEPAGTGMPGRAAHRYTERT